jgi:DNA-binding MarR family transcriptional regulator
MPLVPTTLAKPRKRFDSPQQEAFLSLWRTYDRLRLLEDELFGRHELTAQQYNALRLLRAARPKKVATLALASRLVSRAPDVTRLLDKLADRGLIERERLPENRRVVHVDITDAGLELLDQLADEVRRCHEQQLGHLNGRELQTLIELLRKVREPHEPAGSIWQ